MREIPWFRPETDESEKKRVLEVLDSNYLNEGELVKEFESRVAQLIKVPYCVAVCNGTSAITLSLMALGIGPGDQVIVPDLTFIATANAVRLSGAEVLLVDIEPNRLTLSFEEVKKVMNPKVKAIVTVDVNGRGASYELFEPFCKERGIHLVCDSAEALGSQYNGRYLGTYGKAGCFSFSANKTVSTGQGGMIATHDEELYFRLSELKDQGRRFRGTGGNDHHPVIGFNFKYTNLQAAVGLAQLEKLRSRLEKSQWRDRLYHSKLSGVSGLEWPPIDHSNEVRQWTDVLIADPKLMEQRFEQLKIGFRRFWYPLHTQQPYLTDERHFKNAIDISKRGFWLASHFSLSESDIDYISEKMRTSV